MIYIISILILIIISAFFSGAETGNTASSKGKIHRMSLDGNKSAKMIELLLKDKDNLRETLYVEVLDLIASFEVGLAYELEKEFKNIGRKLVPSEVDNIFSVFSEHPLHSPLVNKARIKMASRDLHFRDAFHKKLE